MGKKGNRGENENNNGSSIIDRQTGKIKSKPIRVVEFSPPDGATVIFSRPEIYARFNLPVTSFSVSLTPEVEGSTYYIPDKFMLIFFPEEDLLLSSEYKVYVSARDIFSGRVTRFSWTFFTPRAFSGEIHRDEVRITRCFKSKYRIKLEFSQPVTFQVYVNSYKLSEGIYRGFPVEIESDKFVKEGGNTVDVVAISTSLEGEYVRETFSFTITKDDTPPSTPSILSVSRTEFVVSSRDNCTPENDIRYLLFWSDEKSSDKMKEIGEVSSSFDTKHIAFDGGFICVKARDSAGNVSDCSEKKNQGFSSEEFTLSLPCSSPFFFSDFIACNLQNKGERSIVLYTSPLSTIRIDEPYPYHLSPITRILEMEGEIVDACDNEMVMLTDKGLIFIEETTEGKINVMNTVDLGVKGNIISCSTGHIFVSDGENIYVIEDKYLKSTFSKKSMRFKGIPFVNDEAKIKDVFATPVSVFVVLSDWTPAYFISQATGDDYDKLKNEYSQLYTALLVFRIDDLASILFAKEYFDDIRKFYVFSGIPVYLVREDMFADFSLLKGIENRTQIAFQVKDMFLIDYDGDIKKELIFLISSEENEVSGENDAEKTSQFLLKIIDDE